MISELTQSMINMFSRCAAQFENRYIKGIIIPPGVAARKGSSVHRGAEHNYRHIVDTGEPAPVDEVQDVTHDEFMRLVKEEGVWLADDEVPEKEQILTTSMDEAIAASRFYHQQFAPLDHEIGLVEERLYADIGCGIPISGKPDVVCDGRIPDLKTSGKRWVTGREDLEIQPTMYRILCRENGLGELPFEYRILVNMKNAPKGDNCIWDKETGVCGEIRPAERTAEHEESLKARIVTVKSMLDAGNFPPAFPDTWWCSPKWCGYFSKCKYTKGRKLFPVTV